MMQGKNSREVEWKGAEKSVPFLFFAPKRCIEKDTYFPDRKIDKTRKICYYKAI